MKNGRGSKYNWPALKLQYFQAPTLHVEEFIRGAIGVWNGNMSKQTLGWRAGKDVYLAEQARLALEKFKKDSAKQIADTLQTMSFVVSREADRLLDSPRPKTRDIKHIWEMARTEGGMPTRISKMDMDLSPAKFDEARKTFDEKFNENSNKSNATSGKSNEGKGKQGVSRKPKSR